MINLAELREFTGKSRPEVAEQLGFSKSNGRTTVLQVEKRHDWLLSSLARYIAALGGTAEIVVKLPANEGYKEMRYKL